MRISPKVGVLLLLTLSLCVGVQAQGKHSSSHWRACMVSSTDLSQKKKYLCLKLVRLASQTLSVPQRRSLSVCGTWISESDRFCGTERVWFSKLAQSYLCS